jgi:hypothetical protein
MLSAGPPASYAKHVPHDGQLNEIVLENSRK